MKKPVASSSPQVQSLTAILQPSKRLSQFLYLSWHKQHCLGKEIDFKFTLFRSEVSHQHFPKTVFYNPCQKKKSSSKGGIFLCTNPESIEKYIKQNHKKEKIGVPQLCHYSELLQSKLIREKYNSDFEMVAPQGLETGLLFVQNPLKLTETMQLLIQLP